MKISAVRKVLTVQTLLAEFQHGTNIYDAVINRIYNGNVDTVIILPRDRPYFILSLADGHCDRPI